MKRISTETRNFNQKDRRHTTHDNNHRSAMQYVFTGLLQRVGSSLGLDRMLGKSCFYIIRYLFVSGITHDEHVGVATSI